MWRAGMSHYQVGRGPVVDDLRGGDTLDRPLFGTRSRRWAYGPLCCSSSCSDIVVSVDEWKRARSEGSAIDYRCSGCGHRYRLAFPEQYVVRFGIV